MANIVKWRTSYLNIDQVLMFEEKENERLLEGLIVLSDGTELKFRELKNGNPVPEGYEEFKYYRELVKKILDNADSVSLD